MSKEVVLSSAIIWDHKEVVRTKMKTSGKDEQILWGNYYKWIFCLFIYTPVTSFKNSLEAVRTCLALKIPM